uniref:DUF834 domain-containing protein n=1 Tax=Oryza nivara TaxID=4536 RepID=A0A0E0IAY3_ORYNI
MLLHCLAGVEPALPEHETEHHEASYVWMYGGTGQDVGGKERVGVESILIFEVKLPEVRGAAVLEDGERQRRSEQEESLASLVARPRSHGRRRQEHGGGAAAAALVGDASGTESGGGYGDHEVLTRDGRGGRRRQELGEERRQRPSSAVPAASDLEETGIPATLLAGWLLCGAGVAAAARCARREDGEEQRRWTSSAVLAAPDLELSSGWLLSGAGVAAAAWYVRGEDREEQRWRPSPAGRRRGRCGAVVLGTKKMWCGVDNGKGNSVREEDVKSDGSGMVPILEFFSGMEPI